MTEQAKDNLLWIVLAIFLCFGVAFIGAGINGAINTRAVCAEKCLPYPPLLGNDKCYCNTAALPPGMVDEVSVGVRPTTP